MASTATDRIDGLSTSTAVKPPVRVATTADIEELIGLLTVDGVVLADGDRVLVKSQTNPVENGIYIARSTRWERARDFDGARDATNGTVVRVREGTVNAEKTYGLTTANPVTFGSSSITWEEVSFAANANGSLVTATSASTARTLADRFADITNVLDFVDDGVDPTGAASSRAGLQAAFDVAGENGHVYFPDGTYLLSQDEEVQVYPGQTISGNGYGSILKMAESSSTTTAVGFLNDETNGSSGVDVRGLRFQGPMSANHTSQTGAGYGIYFRQSDGQSVHNCWFENLSGGGVRMDGDNLSDGDPREIRIQGNHFVNCFRGLWLKHGVDDTAVIGNVFNYIGAGAIALDDISDPETYGPQPVRSVISGNIIYKTAQVFANGDAIIVQAGRGCAITGNVLEECGKSGNQGNGITISAGGNATVGVQYGEGFTVTGNTIIRATTYGIRDLGTRNSVIAGNVILSVGWNAGASSAFAIILYHNTVSATNYGTQRARIQGNVIGRLTADSSVTCNTALRVESTSVQYCTFQDNTVDPACCTNVYATTGGASATNVVHGTRSSDSDTTYYVDAIGISAQKRQSFVVEVYNDAGTLKARIGRPYIDGSLASNFIDKISNTTQTLTDISTQVASGQDFATFCGVLSGAANVLVLDTATHATAADANLGASVSFNSAGTAVTVVPTVISRDIGGSTRTRLELRLFDATTGAAHSWSTSNIASGKGIHVLVNGYIAA